MIQENPDNIKKAKIVVGIPSYNEAKTISFVTKAIDKGLEKYFKNETKVIINVDNDSPDDTGKIFLKTPTKSPKIYISTPPNTKGKGRNLHNLFLKSRQLNAKAIVTIDADIRNLTPKWLDCFIGPILKKKYDYLTPIYYRHKFDGSITNHLCYPLTYGLLGYNIRQPIGGDFSFSNKMADYWLKQKWEKNTKEFGIDIFMTLKAIKSGLKIGQVDLGSKIHNPSAPKLNAMFLEVTDTLFKLITNLKPKWKRNLKQIKELPPVCKAKGEIKFQKLKIDSEAIEEKAFSQFEMHYQPLKNIFQKETQKKLEEMFLKEKQIDISPCFWAEIVYESLKAYQKIKRETKKEELIKLVRALYFARIYSFIKENSISTHKKSEQRIKEQAKCFFKKRNLIFN